MNRQASLIHRALKWAVLFGVLIWALSGLLHPVMSWTAPRPAERMAPPLLVALPGRDPGPLLQAAGIMQSRGLILSELNNRAVWLVRPMAPDALLTVLDAETGARIISGERDRAIALARHFRGHPKAEIVETERLTAFRDDYPAVNRIVPVWRVRFAGPEQLDYYIDVPGNRFMTAANAPRRVMLSLFQHLHTAKFLEGLEPLRLALLSGLLLAITAMSVTGIIMLLRWRGRAPLRRWHRWLGYVAAPAALAWPLTGLLHLWTASTLSQPAPAPAAPFAITEGLRLPDTAPDTPFGQPIASLTLHGGYGGEAPIAWRYEPTRTTGPAEAQWFSPDGLRLTQTDTDQAVALARRTQGWAPDQALELETLTRFRPDYGFDKKRLPVVAITPQDAPDATVYISVTEAIVAARRDHGLKTLDAYAFDIVHKWSFADPLGKVVRDLLMSLCLLALLATALIGIWIGRRQRLH